jgi:5'-3' exonuclease
MKVLVDVSSLIKTCLYAGKDPEAILASDGAQVNSARWGYDNTVNSLVATLDYLKCVPSDIVFAVEGFHSKSRRQHIDKGYKQDAKPKAPEMFEQFNEAKTLVLGAFRKLGSIQVTQDGVEADDIIAWFCTHTKEDTVIVSNDGDLCQLLGMNAHGANIAVYRTHGVQRENPYGEFSPKNILVYKATVGDSSDKIKGVPGFGPAKFQALLERFGDDGLTELRRLGDEGSLKELYEQASTEPLVKRLVDGEDSYLTSFRLAKLYPEWCNTLHQPLVWTPGMVAGSTEDLRLKKWESARRLVTADKWEAFKPWATRNIGGWMALDIETSTPDESDDWLAAQDDSKGVDVIGSKLSGMSLTFGPNKQYTVYIPVDHVDTDCVKSEDLRDFIASLHGVTKVIHNTQFEGTVLFNEWGAEWADNGFHGYLPNWLDTKFEASYVDENFSLGLKKLSKRWLDYDQVDYDTVTTLEGEPGSLKGGRLLGEFKKCVKEAVTRVATQDDVIDGACADEFGLDEVHLGDTIEVSPAEFVMVERRQYKMRELSAQHVFDYAADDVVTTSALHNFFKLFMQLENTWQTYLDVEISASYLHTQSFVQGVPIDLAKLQELREIDDKTYDEAWAKLSTYLMTKGWDGCLPPVYDGEPTPKQIKEAFTIVTGEELETAVRKLDRLADAVEAGGSLAMAELIRNRDWESFKTLVLQHFDGQPVFNPGSPKQMQRLFYEVMGLPVRVFNAPTATMRAKGIKQGTPQTNELAVKYAMLDAAPEEAAALEAIRLMKMVSTRRGLYYDTYPYFVHWKTGLVHSSHNQCATNTRRASSSKPNTQQMPKHAKVEGQAARFREVIAPHKKGAVVVSMDFSSQEILLLAEWSHDPVLELAFTGNPPLDLHSKTGVGIWNRNHSLMSYEEFVAAVEDKSNPLHKQAKKYRALGKTVNFGSQYRMAAKKAASVMLVTEEEAQTMLDAKAEAFPVSEAWALKEMEDVKQTGISKTLLGAVRHLGPALLSEDRYEAGKAERQTLSFRIQGSAAEMTKQAEGAMWDMGLVQKYDCRVYFPVHDEVVASVAISDLEPFLLDMHKAMVRPYANMRLPIRSSVSFGPSFGEQYECNNKGTPTQAEVNAALEKMLESTK